jgi:hypothetical protein
MHGEQWTTYCGNSGYGTCTEERTLFGSGSLNLRRDGYQRWSHHDITAVTLLQVNVSRKTNRLILNRLKPPCWFVTRHQANPAQKCVSGEKGVENLVEFQGRSSDMTPVKEELVVCDVKRSWAWTKTWNPLSVLGVTAIGK